MKKGLTEIVFVLDKSGSMNGIKSDAIGGFNAFVEDQKKQEGEVRLTLVLFDSGVVTTYESADIETVEDLNGQTYTPYGGTALLDAIGVAVDGLGSRLNTFSEADKPENVVVVIMTDGEENSSKEYNKKVIQEKVKHQTEKYDWQFIFLGANIDAVKTAESYGISGAFAGDFKATEDGASKAMTLASGMISSYRITGDMLKYNDVDVKKAGQNIGKKLSNVAEEIVKKPDTNTIVEDKQEVKTPAKKKDTPKKAPAKKSTKKENK